MNAKFKEGQFVQFKSTGIQFKIFTIVEIPRTKYQPAHVEYWTVNQDKAYRIDEQDIEAVKD